MKKAKQFFEGHIKDQIAKKQFLMNFFAIIWSNGLENSANVIGLTFKAIKTKKATTWKGSKIQRKMFRLN